MARLSRERWQALSPLLDRALELTSAERRAWLDSLRTREPTLADDVQALLARHDDLRQEGFLEGSAPAAPRPASLAGQQLGAYTLRSPLGQGGMGSVWLAERSDGRYQGAAAVKLLNASLVGRAGEARFKREGSILARLRHPHIAHLIDAGVSPAGQPYLVLEHVDGERIDHYCDRHSLGIEARLRLFLEVLAAVAHAHANLIVHRDLKPSNVLVTGEGRVKLLDFGIAKLLEADPDGDDGALTREGESALTPEYAAPEQLTGAAVTTATDVYALGVVLYLLLAGRHPAGGSTSPAELVRAIVDTEPARVSDVVALARAGPAPDETAARRGTTPRRLRGLLRGDLDNIVAKALSKRPADRYASAEAMADDLRRYLEHRPVSARADSLPYLAAKFVRRHARSVAAVSAVAVLLAGLVGFYTRRLAAERDRARREADKAARVSELLTGLLTSSDPYQARAKREPTVRDVLDAGAQRVEKELAGQPRLQAEMLTVMGRVYQRLGAHDRAQPLLEKALALARASGQEDPQMAQTLNDLGVLLRERGDSAEAEPLLEQALETRRRVRGPEHPEVAVTLVELGRVHMEQDGPERAEPLFREALTIRRRILGEDHGETATSRADLALLLRQKGDLPAAEALFRENLALTRMSRGADHPDAGTALSNLALVVCDRGDPAAAEPMFRQALAISLKALGPSHPDRAAKLNNLSHALRDQGRLDEAVSALEEALQIARPALGESNPRFAVYVLNLARVRLLKGEAPAAEALVRQVLPVAERAWRAEDWRLAAARSLLGGSLVEQGRYAEAEPLLREARRVLKDIPGPQAREAQATRERLAALERARSGRLPAASPRP